MASLHFSTAHFGRLCSWTNPRLSTVSAFGCSSTSGTSKRTCAAPKKKGVDTHIATAMISLAWIDNYDVAVLVSSDRDFIPVVEFLETRGIKVVHGAFPPAASDLTRKCWGSIAIPDIQERLRR